MAEVVSKKKKDAPAIWTDANKGVLIDALVRHSEGRYSNLSNAKGKWRLIVSDFESATGQLLAT